MKTCSLCKETKEASEYYKYARNSDGLQSRCKFCHSGYYRDYYTENKETYKKRAAEDFQKNKEAHYRRKYKYRQKVASDVVHLNEEEKARVEYFYWLAKDLKMITGEPHEVDHIRPISKGGKHHPDNLQVLPRVVNRSKGNKVWQEH